ncbi:hypothetical protein [Nocardia sp. IFM 10818]
MRRIALAATAAALLLTSCDIVGGDDPPPPTDPRVFVTPTTPPSASTSHIRAPSAASPDQIRRTTCEDLLPVFADIRSRSGLQAVDAAVAARIADLPAQPGWEVFTEQQREATIAGVRDAGTGTCP